MMRKSTTAEPRRGGAVTVPRPREARRSDVLTGAAGTAPLGPRFWLFWSSNAVSAFGDGLRSAAWPLLAATMTHDPFLISLVTVVGFLPWLLIGGWAGVIGDLFPSKATMLVCELARWAVTAAFVALIAADAVTIPVICALTGLLTALQIVSMGAATSLLTEVVGREDLARANGRLESGRAVLGIMVGAPVGALLFSFSHLLPFVIDSLTFLAAAVLIGVLRVSGREGGGERRKASAMIGESWRFFAKNKALQTVAGLLAVVNFVTTGIYAILVLYVLLSLSAPAYWYGILTGAIAFGAFASGFLVRPLLRRLPLAAAVGLAMAVRVLALIAIALAQEPVVAAVAFVAQGVSMTVWNVISSTLVQQTTPPEMLSRAGTIVRTVSISASPLGALAAGVLAQSLGTRSPMAFGALLLAAAGVFAVVRLNRLGVRIDV